MLASASCALCRGLAVDGEQDIAGLQAGLLRGTADVEI
jgi:hypothetical protein